MKHIENLIFIILIGCLSVCVLFWREISQIQVPQKPSSPVTAQLQEDLDRLPQVASFTPLPPLELPKGRDIFRPPWSQKEVAPSTLPPVEKIADLSTIVWSQSNPLAIINGEILAADETDSKSLFKVEAITHDSVQIRRMDNQKTVVLTLKENP